MRKVDLAVVGAGPAGLAAAVEASACGLSVVVLDEQPTIGGQIYRHIERVVEAAPGRTAALGDDYRESRSHKVFEPQAPTIRKEASSGTWRARSSGTCGMAGRAV